LDYNPKRTFLQSPKRFAVLTVDDLKNRNSPQTECPDREQSKQECPNFAEAQKYFISLTGLAKPKCSQINILIFWAPRNYLGLQYYRSSMIGHRS